MNGQIFVPKWFWVGCVVVGWKEKINERPNVWEVRKAFGRDSAQRSRERRARGVLALYNFAQRLLRHDHPRQQ